MSDIFYVKYVDPSGDETWKYCDNWVNTMVATALSPNVTRCSAVMILTHWPMGDLNAILKM